MRSAPATAPARDDPAPHPATGLPEGVLVPAGRVPRREISATTCPWESHPSEPPFATALRLSTCREPERWDVCIPVRRCSPACRLTHILRAPTQCIFRRDASCRVLPRLRGRGWLRPYWLQAIASRPSISCGRLGDVHLLPFIE